MDETTEGQDGAEEPTTGSPDAEPAPGGEAGPQLTPEEMEMLDRQMRELTVQDVLTQMVVSVLNLTARRIAKEDEVDLEQARVGIEAVRALIPLLPEQISTEIREPLSQIQLMYANKAGGGASEADSGAEGPDGSVPGEEAPKGPDGSGLWTPPGT